MQNRHNYQGVYLTGLAVLFFALTVWIRFRLSSVPLERDEGEYAYMAQQLLQGILPYSETQSMKFPGIYFVYAGILTLFGESPSAIHLSLILFNLATAFILFLLGRHLLNLTAGVFAAVSFSVLTLSPEVQGLWANSEHFVLLPALAGILLLLVMKGGPAKFFLSGILLGSSLLIKQHAVFYCLFGAFYMGFRFLSRTQSLKIRDITLFAVGGIIPLLLTLLLYSLSGHMAQFWFSTVQYASEYVSLTSFREGYENFKYSFARILEYNFSILWLALIGLASIAWVKDKKERFVFLFSFFIFLFLAITPGFYFRPHYFLLWIPALCLLAGAGVESLVYGLSSPKIKNFTRTVVIFVALAIPFLLQKDIFFNMTPFQVTRMVYGLNPFAESLQVASYIREHSSENQKVAVLGSEAQIYFFSNRKSATRHIYMYPLMERHVYARGMRSELVREIETNQPEFVVIANLGGSWVSQRPYIPPTLNDWSQVYLKHNYEIRGVVDIRAGQKSVFKWDEEAKSYNPKSRYHLLIHKRRS